MATSLEQRLQNVMTKYLRLFGFPHRKASRMAKGLVVLVLHELNED